MNIFSSLNSLKLWFPMAICYNISILLWTFHNLFNTSVLKFSVFFLYLCFFRIKVPRTGIIGPKARNTKRKKNIFPTCLKKNHCEPLPAYICLIKAVDILCACYFVTPGPLSLLSIRLWSSLISTSTKEITHCLPSFSIFIFLLVPRFMHFLFLLWSFF